MAGAHPLTEKARHFAALHAPGKPLLLYNCWDVISGRSTASVSPALATGSYGVAVSQGYADGQDVPLDAVIGFAERLCAAVDVPVSLDFEAGYSDDPDTVAGHVGRLMDAGVVGINLEDGLSGTARGLVSADRHAAKIAAIRSVADARGVPFFINARSDVFLLQTGSVSDMLSDVIARAQAYADAGASGLFVPMLLQPNLIRAVVEATALPVNIMGTPKAPPVAEMAALGVARISLGGWPISTAMAAVTEGARRFAADRTFPTTGGA